MLTKTDLLSYLREQDELQKHPRILFVSPSHIASQKNVQFSDVLKCLTELSEDGSICLKSKLPHFSQEGLESADERVRLMHFEDMAVELTINAKRNRHCVQDFRTRQKELGRKSRQFYLTESEFEQVKAFIEELRK